MSYADVLKAYLASDTTLMSYLSGGIYTWEETKRLGFSRNSTPSAYSSGFLIPSMFIKARDEIPQNNIPDEDYQFTDTETIVEIWAYTDGDNDSTPLVNAQARVYSLIQNRRVSQSFYCRLVNAGNVEPDPGNDRSKFLKYDYLINSFLG